MNNSTVHQTLIEIEQNLKTLESARNQVNRVSESSQKLIETVSALIKNFETLESDIVKETQNFSRKIDQEFSKFQTKIETGAKNAINQSSKLHQKHEIEIDKTIDKLSDLQKNLNQVGIDLSNFDLESRFSSISNTLGEFESEMGTLGSEVKVLSEKTNTLINDQQELKTEIQTNFNSLKGSLFYTQISIGIATLILIVLILVF